jgi:hypothetical protein
MTYEKLRYIEQLLSNIYKEGLIDEYKQEIELYFQENYGEDALVKTVSIKKEENKIIQQMKSLDIPSNLEDILRDGVKRALGEIK